MNSVGVYKTGKNCSKEVIRPIQSNNLFFLLAYTKRQNG